MVLHFRKSVEESAIGIRKTNSSGRRKIASAGASAQIPRRQSAAFNSLCDDLLMATRELDLGGL